MCIPAGTENSLSEDFLLAKHTSHKHPHHDEPLSPLASWFPWINIPHPREPLRKGLEDEAAIEGFEKQLWGTWKIILCLPPLCKLQQSLAHRRQW
jgi:hypothetical protein